MKQRFGLDAISYLTDSAIRWSKPPQKSRVESADGRDAKIARLLQALERKQRETDELLSELRRRVEQSA